MSDPRTAKVADPWQWFPEMGPWFDALPEQATVWKPSAVLTGDGPEIARIICKAAEDRAPWLYHPCVSAITHNRSVGRLEREVALAGWLALHAQLDGELVLADPTWCWSEGGGFLLDSGTHNLQAIGAALAAESGGPEIALDPWCTILGYAHPDSWVAGERSSDAQQAGVRSCTMVALRSLAILRAALPNVADWLLSFAKLLVFLDGRENLSRSSSSGDLPGIIFADTTSEIALLEVLIHESAHHLLYVAETGGPLIDPADTRRFSSPLRPDPRPLRGILLAYHALAFICAFYKDLGCSALGDEASDPADLADLRDKMAEAGSTLDGAVESLTDRGFAFMRATHEVACYAS